jgi:hypothetical protein
VEVTLTTSNKTIIRTALIFAEGIFEVKNPMFHSELHGGGNFFLLLFKETGSQDGFGF